MHAFAQFRKDLIEMVGLDHARRILTRFGYFWGQADAAAMKRIFEWDSLAELAPGRPAPAHAPGRQPHASSRRSRSTRPAAGS